MKSMDLSFNKIVVDWINFCIQNSRSLKFDHRVFHFERGPKIRVTSNKLMILPRSSSWRE